MLSKNDHETFRHGRRVESRVRSPTEVAGLGVYPSLGGYMTTSAAQTGRRKRARIVLVLEDDVDCRENICSTLKEAGYAALEAADGAHALRLLLAEDK